MLIIIFFFLVFLITIDHRLFHLDHDCHLFLCAWLWLSHFFVFLMIIIAFSILIIIVTFSYVPNCGHHFFLCSYSSSLFFFCSYNCYQSLLLHSLMFLQLLLMKFVAFSCAPNHVHHLFNPNHSHCIFSCS
jgi:hypothetical protein